MEQTKKCSKCGEVKGLGEFGKSSRSPDGKQRLCKQCDRLKCEQWRRANPAKAKAARDDWRARHPDVVKQYSADYYKKNPQKGSERRRANVEAYRATKTAWRKKNIDSERQRETQWKHQNRDKVKAANKQRIDNISPAYAAGLMNLPVAIAPLELIALKREQLAIKRMARELKKAATKPTGETQ